MQGNTSKRPNSATAPTAIDQPNEIHEQAGRIVLEPAPPPAFDLEHLIAAITDDNLHTPIDADPPLGNEHW